MQRGMLIQMQKSDAKWEEKKGAKLGQKPDAKWEVNMDAKWDTNRDEKISSNCANMRIGCKKHCKLHHLMKQH